MEAIACKLRVWRATPVMLGAMVCALALCGGCSQSLGPDGIQQDAGPFHQSVGPNGISQGSGGFGPSQSVGPGGVQQNAGPFHQSVGPSGVQQGTGGGARPAASCQISCGGYSQVANCPAGSTPVCQCERQPYAACATPSR